MRYITRVTEIAVLPEHESLTSELTTHVRIVEEGAGEFVEVAQHGRVDIGKIQINPDEWQALRDTIDQMIPLCQPERAGGRDE
jgi:hypothetical protein